MEDVIPGPRIMFTNCQSVAFVKATLPALSMKILQEAVHPVIQQQGQWVMFYLHFYTHTLGVMLRHISAVYLHPLRTEKALRSTFIRNRNVLCSAHNRPPTSNGVQDDNMNKKIPPSSSKYSF
jgi:hypothetical protein